MPAGAQASIEVRPFCEPPAPIQETLSDTFHRHACHAFIGMHACIPCYAAKPFLALIENIKRDCLSPRLLALLIVDLGARSVGASGRAGSPTKRYLRLLGRRQTARYAISRVFAQRFGTISIFASLCICKRNVI
jgi:hypothetical protein